MFVVLVLSCLALWLVYKLLSMRPKNFPPGPPHLPLLGSGPWIKGENLYLLMEKWRDQYGPVVGVMLGSKPAIAVVEPKAVIQLLKSEPFQGRLNTLLIKEASFGERLGVFMTDGPYWVEQRRFALRHLKEFGFGKRSMEGIILDEADQLLKELQDGSSQTVQVSGLFSVSVINVLWAVMAGTRYQRDDAEFKSLLAKLDFQFRNGNPTGTNFAQMFPRFRFLSPLYRKTYQNNLDLQEFIRKTIRDHEKSLDGDNPRDFMDVYIKEMQQGQSDSTFTEKSLISVCLDLFSAGAESVTNTLAFSLLYLVLHPEVQAKVHLEIDNVIGSSRRPSLDDKPSLVYCEAVLLEVMRMNTIAPLTVPHRATEDAQFMGYNIPKGTIIFVSIWSCLQDVKHWGDPTEFRPERHIGQDGRIMKNERLIYSCFVSCAYTLLDAGTILWDVYNLISDGEIVPFRINNMRKKLRNTLYTFYTIRNVLNTSTLELFIMPYHQYQSTIQYGILNFGETYYKHLETLIIM